MNRSATALAATLAAALAAPAAAQPRVNVYVFDFDFSINQPGQGPIEDAVVNIGDIVVWIPLDEFHNTVACTGQAEFWDSPILDLTDTFEWQFNTPGTYVYYCAPHGQDNGNGTASGMWGTITVVPGPAGAALLAAASGAAVVRRRRPVRLRS